MSDPFDSQILYGDPNAPVSERPRKEKVYKALIVLAAVVVVLAGIKAANGLIGPMMLALFLSIILLVPLRWLQKKGCPKALSFLIVLGGTTVVFVAIGYVVAQSMNGFIRSIPSYRTKIVRKLDDWEKTIEQFGFHFDSQGQQQGPPEENRATKNRDPRPEENRPENPETSPSTPGSNVIAPAAPSPPESGNGNLAETPNAALPENEAMSNGTTATEPETADLEALPPDDASDDEGDDFDEVFDTVFHEARKQKPPLLTLDAKSVVYWASQALAELRHLAEGGFLVLIFTIFMIFEAARFPAKVDRAFGKEGPINNEHFHRIAEDIRRYLFLKAISSLMSAVAATFVYWIFGVPAMLFWGIVAFFLYFIPNVGGTLAAIIPGLLIFMTHDVQGLLLYIVCLVAIECAIAYGIEPKMLGHGLGISTVVIILSLFTWGWILGPIGLFLAAPLTIMVKIIFQAFKETEWIAILLGNKV